MGGREAESANVDYHFKEFGSEIQKRGGRFIPLRWGKTRNMVETGKLGGSGEMACSPQLRRRQRELRKVEFGSRRWKDLEEMLQTVDRKPVEGDERVADSRESLPETSD